MLNTTTKDRFYKNLGLIRKCALYSAQELANELQITRQTIINLENNKSKLTMIDYFGIRYYLILNAKNTELSVLINIIENSELTVSQQNKLDSLSKMYLAPGTGRRNKASVSYKGLLEEALKILGEK